MNSLQTGISEQVLQIVLSFGFFKWLWDGGWFMWKHLYQYRVKADLFLGYEQLEPGPDGLSAKSVFLSVQNGTNAPVAVEGIMYEDSLWYRLVGRHVTPKIIVRNAIMSIPAKSGMQMRLQYQPPHNLVNGNTRYFGLHLSGGKRAWVKTGTLRRLQKEYKRDFPDWKDHKIVGFRPRFKESEK